MARATLARIHFWRRIQLCLYWCNIPRGRMYRYDPRTLAVEIVRERDAVGGFAIESGGALFLFKQSDAIARWERWRRCGPVSTETQKGSLYRLDTDGSFTLKFKDC
jgi:sugar lactone lactonase YvrE